MDSSSSLYSFIASMPDSGGLRVEERLGEGYVRLRVSEAERRQAQHDIQRVEDIVIELLRNARDAGAMNIYVATGKEEGTRSITVIDDGCGIPSSMWEHVFEARVTSKLDTMSMDAWGVHGRGMALFSIRENVDDAHVCASGDRMGTSLRVTVDTARLPERADQSTWPEVERAEDGSFSCVRGPHNIVRVVCEFALGELHKVNVYLGSPADIAATLYEHGCSSLEASQLLFVDSYEGVPVCQRLGCAADAADFMRIASSMGLDISERTAHRILSGVIRPVRSVTSKLFHARGATRKKQTSIDLSRDRRGLKMASEDVDAFSRSLERDFAELGDRYYLYLQEPPKVHVGRDRITVVFNVGKESS